MPPPYWSGMYRGYELVQWHEGGAVEVNATGAYPMYLTSEPTKADAEALVDSYLYAP